MHTHLGGARDGRGERDEPADLLRLKLAEPQDGGHVVEGNEELLLAVVILDVLGVMLGYEVLRGKRR